MNGRGRERDVAKKSKVPEGQRPLVAVAREPELPAVADEIREGEAMLAIVNAIGGALEDITSDHWRRALEPLRVSLADAASQRLPQRPRLSASR